LVKIFNNRKKEKGEKMKTIQIDKFTNTVHLWSNSKNKLYSHVIQRIKEKGFSEGESYIELEVY
jgi:hypothetical protein